MDVSVRFLTPVGMQVLEILNISGWDTDRGELRLYRGGSSSPFAVFAARQWILLMADEQKGLGSAFDDPQPDKRRTSQRMTNASDLAIPDAASVERARAASVQFAIDGKTIPWSEAHMKALKHYEDQVRDEYGEEAVLNLPWNKVPRMGDGVYR